MMGLAGEIGWAGCRKATEMTYRNRIIDAVYNMDAETLERGVKYEVR